MHVIKLSRRYMYKIGKFACVMNVYKILYLVNVESLYFVCRTCTCRKFVLRKCSPPSSLTEPAVCCPELPAPVVFVPAMGGGWWWWW